MDFRAYRTFIEDIKNGHPSIVPLSDDVIISAHEMSSIMPNIRLEWIREAYKKGGVNVVQGVHTTKSLYAVLDERMWSFVSMFEGWVSIHDLRHTQYDAYDILGACSEGLFDAEFRQNKLYVFVGYAYLKWAASIVQENRQVGKNRRVYA